MTVSEAEAIKVIKSECYTFNPLNFDRTRLINTALDMAVEALETIDRIKSIAKNDIQCDAIKYQMICEVVNK